jgi:hypothetical protein
LGEDLGSIIAQAVHWTFTVREQDIAGSRQQRGSAKWPAHSASPR